MDVAGYPSDGSGEPIALGTAGPGEIIDLSRALADEAAASGTPVVMQPIPMPASVQSWLRNNAPYPSAPGPIGYLCRCEELKRYAEADGIPDVAIVPRMLPPDSNALVSLASDTEPPALPPVVLAVPGPPDMLSIPTPTTLTVPPAADTSYRLRRGIHLNPQLTLWPRGMEAAKPPLPARIR